MFSVSMDKHVSIERRIDVVPDCKVPKCPSLFKIIGSESLVHPFIHRKIFIQHLLGTRHYVRHGGYSNKQDSSSFRASALLKFMPLPWSMIQICYAVMLTLNSWNLFSGREYRQ